MHIESFDQTYQKSNLWLKEIMAELHYESEKDAYHALRAVLHALRDRMPVDEAAHFAAQLPMLLKGVYYDGWKPAGKPVKMDRSEFLQAINTQLKGEDAGRAFIGVMAVIARHVTLHELRDVMGVLPQDIVEMVREAAES